MTNMSAEINRLTTIQLQRITARADEEKLKADLETAREFQVHLYMRWLTQQHRQMFILLFVFVIIVLQKEANEEYYKEQEEQKLKDEEKRRQETPDKGFINPTHPTHPPKNNILRIIEKCDKESEASKAEQIKAKEMEVWWSTLITIAQTLILCLHSHMITKKQKQNEKSTPSSVPAQAKASEGANKRQFTGARSSGKTPHKTEKASSEARSSERRQKT